MASVHQVCELQSSLSSCREELTSYLQQMEDVKKNYESQLQMNKDKVKRWLGGSLHCRSLFAFCNHPVCISPVFLPFQVSSLQEKLRSTSLVCQRFTDENLQLQLSLQQQQTMLTESNTRISDLEECQSQLEGQVIISLIIRIIIAAGAKIQIFH